jgi:hypothetical protein
VQLLKQLDIGFRVRRLRFFIRTLSAHIPDLADPAERTAAERLKAALHAVAGPFQMRRAPSEPPEAATLATVARAVLAATAPEARVAAAGAAIDRLAAALDLSALDAEADAVLVAAIGDAAFSRAMRHGLVRAWLGFPFYDIAILPLMQEDGADSFDEMKVDRISPEDATLLRDGGARACLKGWQLNSFAAFFSRAYRENDYLWGRLHAAERLVEILLSSVPEPVMARLDAQAWKGELFAAILAVERPALGEIEPLFEELGSRLAQWGSAGRGTGG